MEDKIKNELKVTGTGGQYEEATCTVCNATWVIGHPRKGTQPEWHQGVCLTESKGGEGQTVSVEAAKRPTAFSSEPPAVA